MATFQAAKATLAPLARAMESEVVVGLTVCGYLSLLFLLSKNRPALPKVLLDRVFLIHNLILAVVSLFVLIPLGILVFNKWLSHGLLWLVCSPQVLDDERLWILFYVNYSLKFYELLDTILLVLKGKPLTFLHVFHHAATLVLCWIEIVGAATVQWLPILLNCAVHVLMYSYYAATTLHISVPWKQSLTSLQIIQFVLDIVACYFCLYAKVAWQYANLPQVGVDCNGSYPAALFGCALLTFYLILFINFFRETYKSKPNSVRKPNSNANANANAKKQE
jgi:fatty acid elongase 3